MVTRIASMGTGVGVSLDAAIVRHFGLADGSEVEVIVEDDRIVLVPRRNRPERLAAAAAAVLAEHDDTFRRLAR
jgi:antitoxin component of MazEF toxin-antitoxin module